jgi:hypothetical protein
MTGDRNRQVRIRAYWGFGALGKGAEPAKLWLANGLYDTYPIANLAAVSLVNCGFDGIKVLTNHLSNVGRQQKDFIASALGGLGDFANANPRARTVGLSDNELRKSQQIAIPALLGLLNDPNPEVPMCAAFSLGRIHQQPDIVVPKLIDMLKRSGRQYRQGPLYALGRYGEQARAAVPEVLKALNSLPADDAKNALKAIDPEAAAKMGIK